MQKEIIINNNNKHNSPKQKTFKRMNKPRT